MKFNRYFRLYAFSIVTLVHDQKSEYNDHILYFFQLHKYILYKYLILFTNSFKKNGLPYSLAI